MVFDGKQYAQVLEQQLQERVASLDKDLKLVILMMGENQASEVYVKRKKELGERIGIQVLVIKVRNKEELIDRIRECGDDQSVNGLMVQLPIPGLNKEETQEILDLIPVEKDVDGLTSDNLDLIRTGEQTFLPATVKAVGKIVDEAIRMVGLDIEKMRIAVVGSKGMVGKPLVDQLKRFGFEVGEFDEGDELKLNDYDVVISAVGKEGLIKSEMVKDGVVVIDVGFPKGDFETGIEKKAAFFTPVPGGVGPVTVACLMENLLV